MPGGSRSLPLATTSAAPQVVVLGEGIGAVRQSEGGVSVVRVTESAGPDGREPCVLQGARWLTVSDFETFVAARSSSLLRTAYLLTRDHGRAEDLLQTALGKSWLAWPRIQGDPEAFTRKILVNTYAT